MSDLRGILEAIAGDATDYLGCGCPTCHGTGVHAYDDHHAKPCADCCRHSQGVWQLTEHYGDLNGRWCCLAGCGFTWASLAAYESWSPR